MLHSCFALLSLALCHNHKLKKMTLQITLKSKPELTGGFNALCITHPGNMPESLCRQGFRAGSGTGDFRP